MRVLVSIICMLFAGLATADYFDPMQPPAFALNKYRLEKIKKARPAKPVTVTATKPDPWVLSSILYSHNRKHAIINNTLVKQGEVIKGARLIRLRPNSVRLLSKGKAIDLSLGNKLKSIKKSRDKRKL